MITFGHPMYDAYCSICNTKAAMTAVTMVDGIIDHVSVTPGCLHEGVKFRLEMFLSDKVTKTK